MLAYDMMAHGSYGKSFSQTSHGVMNQTFHDTKISTRHDNHTACHDLVLRSFTLKVDAFIKINNVRCLHQF